MVRTFCVVCREMPIRMQAGLDHIRAAGLPVEPFYGIYAKTYGVKPSITYLHRDGEVKTTTIWHLGCALSHYALWRALEYMEQDETLVLEDDVIIPPDFQKRFDEVYRSLPAGWEFIQLARLPGGDVVKIDGLFGRPQRSYPGGTHCYLISKRGVKRIIDRVQGMKRPIDALLAEDCWPFMEYWCVLDSLAGQRSVTGE